MIAWQIEPFCEAPVGDNSIVSASAHCSIQACRERNLDLILPKSSPVVWQCGVGKPEICLIYEFSKQGKGQLDQPAPKVGILIHK